MSDEINEKDLPPAGNSDARIYPPVEKAKEDAEEHADDPMQPDHGDAAAVRDGGPSPNDAE
jgi:hypothetical protein